VYVQYAMQPECTTENAKSPYYSVIHFVEGTIVGMLRKQKTLSYFLFLGRSL
jgi:hypothetical protein